MLVILQTTDFLHFREKEISSWDPMNAASPSDA